MKPTLNLPLVHYLSHRTTSVKEKCKIHWAQNTTISAILIRNNYHLNDALRILNIILVNIYALNGFISTFCQS